jgi:hypothetical protein
MAVVRCVALAFVALSAGYWAARKRRHRRRAAHETLRRVFRRREYREIDGRRLELGGVNRSMLALLERGAAEERLRPALVTRDGFSYRLTLRGETGAEIEVFARCVTLAL